MSICYILKAMLVLNILGITKGDTFERRRVAKPDHVCHMLPLGVFGKCLLLVSNESRRQHNLK